MRAAQKSDRELRKEAARARAAALRAMYAARRIVRVNEHGCAHGAGRRKTSSAQVCSPHFGTYGWSSSRSTQRVS